jgi:hypothetical protein
MNGTAGTGIQVQVFEGKTSEKNCGNVGVSLGAAPPPIGLERHNGIAQKP